MQKISEILSKKPEMQNISGNWLKVKGTGQHKVKLLRGEMTTNKDYHTGKDIDGILLFFEENGEEKKYFIPQLAKLKEGQTEEDRKFHYLFEKFADIEEGEEIILEWKRKKGSKFEGYVEVRREGEIDEIPVVEDLEGGTGEGF